MKHIDLNFSTDLTSRNQALNAIALEIQQAFNLLAAGLGDEIDTKARDQFPNTPISLSIDVSDYYPSRVGSAQLTVTWGELVQVIDDTDPENPVTQVYGHYVDLRIDLSGTDVMFAQFRNQLRDRWVLATSSQRNMDAWKQVLRQARRAADGLPTDGVTDYTVVEFGDVTWYLGIEYPKHRFADRPEPIVEE